MFVRIPLPTASSTVPPTPPDLNVLLFVPAFYLNTQYCSVSMYCSCAMQRRQIAAVMDLLQRYLECVHVCVCVSACERAWVCLFVLFYSFI